MANGAPEGYEIIRVAALKGRVDLIQRDFDEQIDARGELVDWEQVAPCACSANSQTEQPDPLCAVCGGTGEDYYDKREIRVILDRPKFTPKVLERHGTFWNGVVYIVSRADQPLGFRHRITLKDAAIEYTERTKRTSGSIQALRMPIANRKLYYQDSATKEPVLFNARVTRLTWMSGSTQKVMEEGIDFDITEDGELDWSRGDATGTAPSVSTVIGVAYWMHPRYIVTELGPFPMTTSWSKFKSSVELYQLLPIHVTAMLDFRFKQLGGGS